MIAFRVVLALSFVVAVVSLMMMYGCERGGTPANDHPPPDDIVYQYGTWSVGSYHDDKRKVTCWTSNGISCLPDWFIDHEVDGGTK